MEPLIALVVVTLSLRAAGAAGALRLKSWPVALRGGLAAMFVLTGVVHFVWMREHLIRMVPPVLPAPGVIVTLTGVLELVGAVGLLMRRTAPWAAGGLALLLIAMFPANVYAATHGVATGPEDALLPRTLMQIVFLSAPITIVVAHIRARRSRPSPSAGVVGVAREFPVE